MINVRNFNQNRFAEAPSQVVVDETLGGNEARDIVLGLLQTTTNFHKLRNLRSQTHKEQPDPDSTRRIESLEAARADLSAILAKAHSDGRQVRVRSTVEIEIDGDLYS